MGDCNNRCLSDAKLLLKDSTPLVSSACGVPGQGLWLNWECMVENEAALQIDFKVSV